MRDTHQLLAAGKVQEPDGTGMYRDHRAAVSAGPVAALAMTAALRLMFRIEAEFEQRVFVLIGNATLSGNDITFTSTVNSDSNATPRALAVNSNNNGTTLFKESGDISLNGYDDSSEF